MDALMLDFKRSKWQVLADTEAQLRQLYDRRAKQLQGGAAGMCQGGGTAAPVGSCSCWQTLDCDVD